MFRFVSVVVFSLMLCGCEQEPKPVKHDTDELAFTGTVTLDGKPLPTGRIKFIDEEQNPRREYLAVIENGKFKCNVRRGKKRVEIRSYKIPKNAAADAGPFPQIIPARYNDESELTADLKIARKLNFKLESGESPSTQ